MAHMIKYPDLRQPGLLFDFYGNLIPAPTAQYIPNVIPNMPTYDNGAVINAYLNALSPSPGGDTPQILPPGTIYCQTGIVIPAGVTLVGAGRVESNAVYGTIIAPSATGAGPPATLVTCPNNDSGFKNLSINAGTMCQYAVQVYGGIGTGFENFTALGGSLCTWDTTQGNTGGVARSMRMIDFEINSGQGTGTTVLVINWQGTDGICTHGRMVNGTKILGGGGTMISDVHFTASSGGNAPGANSGNVVDQGGQQFNGCYFDSVATITTNGMIDRTGATVPSTYTGCRYFQNPNVVQGPIFTETTTADAGAVIVGGTVLINGTPGVSTFSYFIKGAIASTKVIGISVPASYLVSGFTDVIPPLGYFAGITIGGVGVELGGIFLGTNQNVRQYTTGAAPTYAIGRMYYDTTLHKLRIGGATAWETVTSV
jgi:hypothetical protein